MKRTNFFSVIGKISSRILLVYYLLYIIPFPLGYIPWEIGAFFSKTVNSFWQWLTPLVIENFTGFKEELSFQGRGSGDTLYDFLLVPTRFFCALILTVLWSVIDKLRNSDSKIYQGFIVILRYYLAFTMFGYGFSKVLYLQFSELNLMSLTRTYGDSSPMGLLWKFMGYSETYTVFTGVMEVLGGVFLLFRRTKVLGALITFGIMLNVFVLNMTFDVPVKLFSFHLLLITLIVVLPDMRNILNFFIVNKPTHAKPISPYFTKKSKNIIGHSLKLLVICYVLFTTIDSKLESQKSYGKRVPKHLLYGIYEVQCYSVNGDTIPPITTDTDRWKQLIVDKRYSSVVKMDGKRIGMKHEIDSLNHSIVLNPFLDGEQGYNLKYKLRDSILFLMEIKQKDTLIISATKKHREDFFLINRGFHWINEYPMQR